METPRPAAADRLQAHAVGIRLAVAGTALFATSAVLVRLAGDYSPLEVASYRLLAGAAFIAVIARFTGHRLTAPRGSRPTPGAPRGWRGTLGAVAAFAPLAGAALAAAIHFAFYVGSLYRTSITHSLVLVNLSPLLAIPLAALVLRERFDWRRLPGALVTIAGTIVMIGLGRAGDSAATLAGDAMAFIAALAYAAYSVIGRSQRQRSNVYAYAFWVYLGAGFLLLPAAQAGAVFRALGDAAGPSLVGLAAILLLGLLPTAGGHTLYNAALRRTDTVTVNLIATQEVTGGVLLGVLLLGETPDLQTAAGALIALAGLFLFLRVGTRL